jgi:hypothetical protein
MRGDAGYRCFFRSHGRLAPVVDRGQTATAGPTTADGPVVRARADVTEHGCSVIVSEYAHVNLRCFIDHSASFPQGSPRAHSPRARMLAHRFARDHAIRAHGDCLSFVARLVGQHAGVRRRVAETGPLLCRRTMRPHRRANRRKQLCEVSHNRLYVPRPIMCSGPSADRVSPAQSPFSALTAAHNRRLAEGASHTSIGRYRGHRVGPGPDVR